MRKPPRKNKALELQNVAHRAPKAPPKDTQSLPKDEKVAKNVCFFEPWILMRAQRAQREPRELKKSSK